VTLSASCATVIFTVELWLLPPVPVRLIQPCTTAPGERPGLTVTVRLYELEPVPRSC
jgi:hypothetical protein